MLVARVAFPDGSLPIRLRERLAEIFADEPFAATFGVRGAPGISPAVLSLVTVLQFAEDLTDRQAAAMAVRAIDWKYAIGAELGDTGFDPSVLSRFRTRLAEHDLERVVFDRLLEHCRQAGLVAAGGKQRSDSTHVINAVCDLKRLELAGESVRAALEALAVAAPTWLAAQIDVPEIAHRYGPRVNGWTMPSSKTKRDRLALVFAQDGYALCRAAWAPGTPAWIREIEAVRFLRQVLVQTYCLSTDNRGRVLDGVRGVLGFVQDAVPAARAPGPPRTHPHDTVRVPQHAMPRPPSWREHATAIRALDLARRQPDLAPGRVLLYGEHRRLHALHGPPGLGQEIVGRAFACPPHRQGAAAEELTSLAGMHPNLSAHSMPLPAYSCECSTKSGDICTIERSGTVGVISWAWRW